MDVTERARVDLRSLRAKLGEPDAPTTQKITDFLDDNCLAFLAHSPFAVLATSDSEGSTSVAVLFTRALDPRTLVIPDRLGNRIADTFTNVLDNPHVGVLSFVPGMTETLRINGSAFVTDDARVLAMLEQDHVVPDLALVVQIEQVYLHCGRALLRSRLWDAEMQDLADGVPSSGQIWASMSGWDAATGDVIDAAMSGAYRALY